MIAFQYGEETYFEFNIEVLEKEDVAISNIEILKMPDKLVYHSGDPFEDTGIEIEVTYSNEWTRVYGTLDAVEWNNCKVNNKIREELIVQDGDTTFDFYYNDYEEGFSFITIPITVEKLDTRIPVIVPTITATLTYTGNEQEVVINNFSGEIMTVVNHRGTNAGEYQATITLIDAAHYCWSGESGDVVTLPWQIQKAEWTMTLSNTKQKSNAIKAVTATISPKQTNGVVIITYGSGESFSTALPKTAGTYTIKVTLSGDNNLFDGSKTGTLTIAEAAPSTGGGGGGGSSSGGGGGGGGGAATPRIPKEEKKNSGDTVNSGENSVEISSSGETLNGDSGEQTSLENTASGEKATEIKPEEVFEDILTTDWFYDAVKYALEHMLFNGVSETEFAPNVTTNRAMLVTVLHRLDGKKVSSKQLPFKDVLENTYYIDAVKWSFENEIINGTTENTFSPNASLTREQLVTILYRYASKIGVVPEKVEYDLPIYDDFNDISEYAVDAFQWAVSQNIITGRTETSLAPKGTATRAEVATILMRFQQKFSQ